MQDVIHSLDNTDVIYDYTMDLWVGGCIRLLDRWWVGRGNVAIL